LIHFGVGSNVNLPVNDFDDAIHARMIVERDPAAPPDDEDADGNVSVLVDADVGDGSISE
jgi:hypothetical protein